MAGWQEAARRLIEESVPAPVISLAGGAVLAFLAGWLASRAGRWLLRNHREAKRINAIVRARGITVDELAALRALARLGEASGLLALFNSSMAFDRCLLRAQEATERDPRRRMLAPEVLMSTREKLGFAGESPLRHLVSTTQIERNQVVQVRAGKAAFFSAILDVGVGDLTLAAPTKPADLALLGPGTAARILFSRPDDAYYEFESAVTELGEGIFKIAHAASMMREQRRRHVRVKCSMKVRYEKTEGRKTGEEALMTDISISGLCVLVKERVPEDTVITLCMAHPDIKGEALMDARVIRCVELGRETGAVFRLHVELAPRPEQEATISRLVSILERAAIRRIRWREAMRDEEIADAAAEGGELVR